MEDTSEPFKRSNISGMLIVDIIGQKDCPAYREALRVVRECGCKIGNGCEIADVAIAPLLTEKISEEVISRPYFGTLIFHPSPLPYGRGAASIKWAYKRHEPITAATWFWADKGLDTGDICEQEIVKIDYELRPREFYEREMLPAMARTLERCLKGLQIGRPRKIPQVEKYATFDLKEAANK